MPEDWQIVAFYQRVSDQFISQAGLQARPGKDQPPLLTPRLEGYEAALRISGITRGLWPELMDGAAMLHRLVHHTDSVDWLKETGKRPTEITPGDINGA